METEMDPKPGAGKRSRKTELDNVLASQMDEVAATGNPMPVDPDVAEMLGAFEDNALDAEEAMASRFDNDTYGGRDE